MLNVIYEDNDVVILNKPAGIAVHAAGNNPEERTLVSEILERWPEIRTVGDDPMRPGIVHRLDKDTSGVLVVAKNQPTFEHLKKQFQARNIKKTYLTLVMGKMGSISGTISNPIGRSKKFGKFTTKIPRLFDGNAGAKLREAITRWQVLKEHKDENGNALTLLEIKPETGRTHQIRVHLASIGHPIVGDKLYGGKIVKKYRETLGRQFLHAHSLEFELKSGGKLRVEAELSDELTKFLDSLREAR